MRKIYTLLAAAIIGLSTNAQNTVFFDDFESNSLEGYTLYNIDGLVPYDPDLETMTDSAWTVKFITAQGWTYGRSAFSVSWYVNDDGPSDDWLVTPAIEIAGNAILEWDALAITSSGLYRDRYKVYISPSAALENIENDAVEIFDTGAIGEETDPTSRSVDLAALGFENETIYICFRNNTQPFGSNPGGPGNGGNELVIDNIKVTDDSPVSTANVNLYMGATLLPNPSNGSTMQVNFSVEKALETQLEIIDITGKVLELKNLGLLAAGSHTISIDRGSMAKGVYLVRLRSAEGSTVLRAVFN
jgi:hypothetical protein